MQLKQNNTLRARATVGTNPKGSRLSDGVTDRTKEKEQRRLGSGAEQGTKHGEADQRWTCMEGEL